MISSFPPGWWDRPRAALGEHWGPPTRTHQGSAARHGDGQQVSAATALSMQVSAPCPRSPGLPTQPRPPHSAQAPHAGFLGTACLPDSQLNSRNPLGSIAARPPPAWHADSQGSEPGPPQLHLPLRCLGNRPPRPAGQGPGNHDCTWCFCVFQGQAHQRPLLRRACVESLRRHLSCSRVQSLSGRPRVGKWGALRGAS